MFHVTGVQTCALPICDAADAVCDCICGIALCSESRPGPAGPLDVQVPELLWADGTVPTRLGLWFESRTSAEERLAGLCRRIGTQPVSPAPGRAGPGG
jgi:hypothetical protein